jgi:hypothetical protein
MRQYLPITLALFSGIGSALPHFKAFTLNPDRRCIKSRKTISQIPKAT